MPGSVEAGIAELGYDRLSIWYFDETNTEMIGTFGTDENGHIRDERMYRRPVSPDHSVRQVIDGHLTFACIRIQLCIIRSLKRLEGAGKFWR